MTLIFLGNLFILNHPFVVVAVVVVAVVAAVVVDVVAAVVVDVVVDFVAAEVDNDAFFGPTLMTVLSSR